MASLTPTPIDSIEPTLRDYGAALRDAPPVARRVWQRIADSRHHRDGDAACWHADAVALCAALGMNPTARAPQDWLSWDGNAVATLTEPESGRIAYADAHKALDAERREIEEQRTSLLGVIWETELGQPAILAFQEQNWLEGAGRPSTADFFVERLSDLIRLGLVDAAHGRPLLALRCLPD
jgi:hypothetical protein